MSDVTDVVSIEELKTMIGLTSDSSDNLLKLIVDKTVKRMRFKLGLKAEELFPDDLSYIPFEVCIRRYNRRANEGMASYTQEGQSFTFSDNDFAEFEQDIEDWKDANQKKISAPKASFVNPYRRYNHATK